MIGNGLCTPAGPSYAANGLGLESSLYVSNCDV
jgi:hypothetical protein